MRALAILLYNAGLLLLYPILFFYTLWRRFVQKKSPASFLGQWGRVPREASTCPESAEIVIWVHAVSVGEVMAARPIARALKRVLPSCRIALSCTTDTGFQTAEAAKKNGEADAVFYFPLDLPFPIWRALNAIRPHVFMAVETELWPSFLHLARGRGVLCFLVNGRVSDNLLQSAPRMRWLWCWILSNLDGLLMRGELDASRMKEICARVGAEDATSRVLTLGDVKLDEVSSTQERQTLRAKWRSELQVNAKELLWICGSTHPYEEEIVLRAFAELKGRLRLRLLLAPRHIERADGVLALCESEGQSAMRRSEIGNSCGDEIIVLDTVGELSEIYAAGDVAFVGGSLIPRGGHNVLEPVLRGAPVLFGSHMANFRAAAQFVESTRLGEQVQNEDELKARLAWWLEHESERAAISSHAREALAPHQGAAMRIAQHIAERLKSRSQ